MKPWMAGYHVNARIDGLIDKCKEVDDAMMESHWPVTRGTSSEWHDFETKDALRARRAQWLPCG